MAGYHNYSMSNNAVSAYQDGERPLSKWRKSDILDAIRAALNSGELQLQCSLASLEKCPTQVLKTLCLYRSSWHHTSSFYNATDFYSLDLSGLEDLTEKEIASAILQQKADAGADTPKDEQWECSFLEWSGSRKHRSSKRIYEVGIVHGNWFIRPNGQKKRTDANGFEFIRRIL